MPQFNYTAFDASGKDHIGVIDAPKAQDAVRTLAGKGLRVQKVSAIPSAIALPPLANIRPAVASPVPTSSPAQNPAQIQPVIKVIRTRPTKDSQLFLWFTQLSNLFRSGISPAKSFEQLGSRMGNLQYSEAFRHIAQLTASGSSVADALAHYPDMFPEGVVGAIRSGETGGYLWQAADQVALLMQTAASLRKFYYWPTLLLWVNVVTFPLIFAGSHAIDKTIATINTPEKQGLTEMGKGLLEGFTGPMMWLTIGLALAVIFGREWSKQSGRRRFRHKLALAVPLLSKRNSSESMAVFSYHLAMLGRAGISPQRSWKLASDAVPNLVLAEDFVKAGQVMTEATPISEAIFRSKAFPHDMACVIETGEMTGRVPESFDQVSEMVKTNIGIYDAAFKINAVIWFGLISICFSALAYAFIIRSYMDSVMTHTLAE